MIDWEKIKIFAKKNQTRTDNIIREYIQHLFLSSLYRQKEANDIYFKGGTALKIIYQSPRFSEDLDFTFQNHLKKSKLENLILNTLSEIAKENIQIELKEAKETSGGYLGIIFYNLFNFKNEILFEVSFRKKGKIEKEVVMISSDYLPPYLIIQLSTKQIVQEKILALLERGKPRDYFDLYFILRHQQLRKYVREKDLEKIKKKLEKEKFNFKKELEPLLPFSYHQILKNFKENLLKELNYL